MLALDTILYVLVKVSFLPGHSGLIVLKLEFDSDPLKIGSNSSRILTLTLLLSRSIKSLLHTGLEFVVEEPRRRTGF